MILILIKKSPICPCLNSNEIQLVITIIDATVRKYLRLFVSLNFNCFVTLCRRSVFPATRGGQLRQGSFSKAVKVHNARNLSNDFTRKLPRDETLKASGRDGGLNRIANVCKIFVPRRLKEKETKRRSVGLVEQGSFNPK